MDKYVPIRKVAVGFIAAAIAYAAHQFGVDLGDEDVNDAALALVGLLAAYLARN